MIPAGIRDYARSCTVSLWDAGKFLGTGFFAAAQTVVTCAHVLQRAPAAITVRWGGRDLPAKILVLDPVPSVTRADFYPPPDIALVAVTYPLDHPSLYVEPGAVAAKSELDVYGFSAGTPMPGVAEDAATIEVVNQFEIYTKFKAGRVVRGMSGSPAIDAHGAVRGMVKSAEGAAEGGGWLVNGVQIISAMRRHRAAIRTRALAAPPLIRPEQGSWLHRMLLAQREIAKQYPYRLGRLSRRATPALSTVYVEQRAQEWENGQGAARRQKRITERNEPVVISPIEMLRRHRNSLVIGGPGGGKSTLMQQVVAESARWWLGEAAASHEAGPAIGPVVAVRVAATELIGQRPLFDLLADAVNGELRGYQSMRLKPEIFDEPPATGAEWLVLIDGLDEVLDEDLREDLVHVLGRRLATYGESARYVITSRWLRQPEFATLRTGLAARDGAQRFGEYSLRPFDWDAVATFAGNWFRPEGGEPSTLSPDDFLASVADRGLRPLVRIPLLTTIAAVVFEESDGQPLPHDRTGLYEQFVEVLLTKRRQQTQTRTMLRAQVSALGRSAEDFVDFLFDHRLDCLTHLALRRMRSDSRPSAEVVREWLQGQGKVLPSGIGQAHVRDALLSTGLVEIQADDLVFIHFSFAEYLAAEKLATRFNPEAWLANAAAGEPDSLSLFTLGRWVRAGNDPVPMMAELLRSSDQQGPQVLEKVAAVIEDGSAMSSSGEAVVELVEQTVRRTSRSRTPQAPWGMSMELAKPARANQSRALAVGKVLSAVLQRATNGSAIIRLARDDSVAISERVEAAKALVTHGSEVDRVEGLSVLIHLAYESRLSAEDRLVPLCGLAEVGGKRERGHAVQRMTMTIETTGNEAVRTRALILMAGINEFPAAAMALVRRGAEHRLSIVERGRALDTLGVLMETLPDKKEEEPWPIAGPYAEAFDFSSMAWSYPSRVALGHDRSGQSSVDFTSALGWALRIAAEFDPPGLNAVLRKAMHDRTFKWFERINVAEAVRSSGYPEAANQATHELAHDRDLPPTSRVTSLTILRDREQLLESVDTLLAWANDQREDLGLRRAAIIALAGTSLMDMEFWDGYVAERSQPASLRLAAVLALAQEAPERDHVLGLLDKLRAEHRPGSRAWIATQVAAFGFWLERRLERVLKT